MGPSAVELSVSEGEAELYRDDEPVEYTRNMSISEQGYYRLDVDGQIWSFTIASAVNRMEYYLLPAGMEVTGVSLDGEALETPEGRYVHMKDDGQYRIAMAGKDGDVLEAVIRKDTEPPQFSVDVKGGALVLRGLLAAGGHQHQQKAVDHQQDKDNEIFQLSPFHVPAASFPIKPPPTGGRRRDRPRPGTE